MKNKTTKTTTTQAQIEALARPGVEEAYIRTYHVPGAFKTPPRPFNEELDDGLEARMEYFDYVEECRKAGGEYGE